MGVYAAVAPSDPPSLAIDLGRVLNWQCEVPHFFSAARSFLGRLALGEDWAGGEMGLRGGGGAFKPIFPTLPPPSTDPRSSQTGQVIRGLR